MGTLLIIESVNHFAVLNIIHFRSIKYNSLSVNYPFTKEFDCCGKNICHYKGYYIQLTWKHNCRYLIIKTLQLNQNDEQKSHLDFSQELCEKSVPFFSLTL